MSETSDRIDTMQQATPGAMTARDARGRVFTIRELGPAQMLNVIEMAGGAAAENQTWLRMALLLSSVAAIDGVPTPEHRTKAAFLKFVDTVGNDGWIAVSSAVAGAAASPADSEAELSAARSI